MKLINIYNNRRTVYLFTRDNSGQQYIQKVQDFYPYYWENHSEGTIKSYTGVPVKKIIVSEPAEVAKRRSEKAWEADVLFVRRYMIDKIDKIEKCPVKWAMMDIEVLANELPDVTIAKYKISCITIYNNFTKLYTTFYLEDYDTEYEMIEDFINYLQKEKFDIIAGWNMEKFDFPYLCNRIPDFASKISPINKTRYSQEIEYPAGISIIDYYSWFKKITLNREKSYKLNDIAQKYLKDASKQEIDFSKLSKELKQKNRLDVEQLVRLEEKFQLIPYFDEIRRLSKVEWEDLLWSSRMLDQLLLQEAKNQKIVLPMKPSDLRGTLNEKEEYEGAYREIFKTGRFENVGKYDLSGAYPTMMIDFCLDSSNIHNQKEKDCIEVDDCFFKQNEKAILPLVVNKMMVLKNELKEKLSSLDPSTIEYKDLNLKYKGTKSLVNSAYGVFGNRFFRLYDKRVASATTFLVRSLMKYIISKLKEKGYEVIYADTDSVMIDNNNEDISNILNALIQDWAKEVYGKEKSSLEFAYEGKFKNLVLLALCRYMGNLETSTGIKKEICGIEAKRKDSTIFMKKFQEELFDKILEGESKENVIKWIQNQIETIKTVPLKNLGFPCKLAQDRQNYKNIPIFVRALNNTENFDKKVGDGFYYIYVIPKEYDIITKKTEFIDRKILTNAILKREWKIYFGEDIDIKEITKRLDKKEELLNQLEKDGRLIIQETTVQNKPKDVMAFDDKTQDHINREDLDWNRIIERNIIMKLDSIFMAMNWNIKDINYTPEHVNIKLTKNNAKTKQKHK